MKDTFFGNLFKWNVELNDEPKVKAEGGPQLYLKLDQKLTCITD